MTSTEQKFGKQWEKNSCRVGKWMRGNVGSTFNITFHSVGQIRHALMTIQNTPFGHLNLGMVAYKTEKKCKLRAVFQWEVVQNNGMMIGRYHFPQIPTKKQRMRVKQWMLDEARKKKIYERVYFLFVLGVKCRENGGLHRYITEYI
tara:strand:- start:325 stop:762 length:438 start_codon:yes stop_codon:yes gene_type:complete